MAAFIQRRCLHCEHAAADPNVNPSQQLENAVRGTDQRICLLFPPTASVVVTDKGLIPVNGFPIVTAQSISCGQWQPRTTEAANGGT